MFLVLLVIESSDVLFAVDSVPAVIGVIPKTFTLSQATFIAFSSNVFAILGLRALYFLLAGMVDVFRYLHYGLAAVLAFVGLKMLAEFWMERQGIEPLPIWTSLLAVALLLGISIAASIVARRREGKGIGDWDWGDWKTPRDCGRGRKPLCGFAKTPLCIKTADPQSWLRARYSRSLFRIRARWRSVASSYPTRCNAP